MTKTINRIQKDLKDKEERRAKLRKTSITMKRVWLQKKLKKDNVTFIQSYMTSSWVCSFKITMNNNDEIATRRYDVDKTNSKWRTYSSESEKDDEVTTIAIETNWECVKRYITNFSETFFREICIYETLTQLRLARVFSLSLRTYSQLRVSYLTIQSLYWSHMIYTLHFRNKW